MLLSNITVTARRAMLSLASLFFLPTQILKDSDFGMEEGAFRSPSPARREFMNFHAIVSAEARVY